MAHFGSPTPKRHYLYGNSTKIHKLDRGRLQWAKLKVKQKEKVITVKQYCKDDRVCFVGTKALRGTGTLGMKKLGDQLFSTLNPREASMRIPGHTRQPLEWR